MKINSISACKSNTQIDLLETTIIFQYTKKVPHVFISFCSTQNSQRHIVKGQYLVHLVISAVSLRAFFIRIGVYSRLICCNETTRTRSTIWGHFGGSGGLTHHYFCTITENTSILEKVNDILVLT